MTIDARVLSALTKLFSTGWTWVAFAAIVSGAVFAWEALNQDVMAEHLNPTLWTTGNLVLFFGYAAIIFYVIFYGLVFDWVTLPNGSPNVGGRLIFNLTASLAGLVSLSLLLTFVTPVTGREWYVPPPEMEFWVPTVRLVIYVWVVATVTAMDVTLVRRVVRAQPLDITVPARTPKD